MIYVYGKQPSYEETEWIGWTEDDTEANKRAAEITDRYTDGVVLVLVEGGGITWAVHRHEPAPYNGPVVRARVRFMNVEGCGHRVPVDCADPRYSHDRKLDADHLWRVVGTSVMPTPESPEPVEFFTCRCGDWQDIEGAPDAVAEMVAKYGIEGA